MSLNGIVVLSAIKPQRTEHGRPSKIRFPRLFQDLTVKLVNMPTRRLILQSGFFDAYWYTLCNPHIVRHRIDPLTHFLKNGKKYRISPSQVFDTERYLDMYEAARKSRLNPLVHYLRFGREQNFAIYPARESDASRIIASGLFDEAWYLHEYPDVAAARYPALLHYMVYGRNETRSPGPHFDAKWYLTQYPDIVGVDPLLHFIDHGREEGRAPLKPVHALNVAKATLEDVEDLDPELYSQDYFADERLAVVSGVPSHRIARAFDKLVRQIEHMPSCIVFLPWIVHGGADLVAGYAVQALSVRHGPDAVLVIVTDHDREDAPHLIPENVQTLFLSRIDPLLSVDERASLVDFLIRSLRPLSVLNVNSGACWEATKRHGRTLVNFTRLYAMLFCADYSPSGRRGGYSDLYLRHCLPYMSAIYFDNHAHVEELRDKFAISPDLASRLVTVYQPISQTSGKPIKPKLSNETIKVLWAGRFAAQKNIELLVGIVTIATEFEFHIWGRGDYLYEAKLNELKLRCPNVHLHGPFERFETLPLADYDIFLYTSLWDGIPNVLLEAAAAKLPIIASHVGGIGELVDDTTGWLIADFNCPEAYLEALQSIADDPQRAFRATNAMSERLEIRHNWQRYCETLALVPCSGGGILYEAPDDNGSLERAS